MSTVRLVEEVEDVERARLAIHAVQPIREDTETATPPKEGKPGRAELIELMGVLARILGFRVQLLLAFMASAGLSAWAVYKGDVLSIVAAALFSAMVTLPILYVAYRRG